MKDKAGYILNNKIKYNVNVLFNTNGLSEKEIIKLFNEKLLKIILSLEKSSICQD